MKIINKIKKIIWLILKKVRLLIIYKLLRKTTYGVRTIIISNQKIFLIKHPYDNFWVLPGGGKGKNETEFETAKRECEEEAGLVITGELKKLGKYFNNKENKNDYITIIIAKNYEKSTKKQRLIDRIEIQKRNWFYLDELPEISSATKLRINEYIGGDFSEEIRLWN